MFLLDCHTHSYYSPDSSEPIDSMIDTAVRRQISVLTVTDHCECDLYEPDGYRKQTLASFEELQQKKKGSHPLKLLCGVEIGQPLQNLAAANEVAERDYDFALGSLHRAKGLPDYYFIDYSGYSSADLRALMEQYLMELLEMVRWNRFDSLAHLTYPLRYIIGDFHLPLQIRQCDDYVRELFVQMIERGKALELNTSGLRQSIGETLPDLYYMKMFRDLGGELVTIGSDAHRAEDLGKGVSEGLHLLKEAGFSHITYFEKHQPVCVPFD